MLAARRTGFDIRAPLPAAYQRLFVMPRPAWFCRVFSFPKVLIVDNIWSHTEVQSIWKKLLTQGTILFFGIGQFATTEILDSSGYTRPSCAWNPKIKISFAANLHLLLFIVSFAWRRRSKTFCTCFRCRPNSLLKINMSSIMLPVYLCIPLSTVLTSLWHVPLAHFSPLGIFLYVNDSQNVGNPVYLMLSASRAIWK